jgi:hypothetical protein
MKLWLWLAAAGAVAAGGVGTSIASGFYNPFDSKMTRLCESILSERLRSPSSYRRVEIRHYDEAIPIDDYRKMKEAEIAKDTDSASSKAASRRILNASWKRHSWRLRLQARSAMIQPR